MSVDRFAATRLAERYSLIERIAAGGMGEGHLALDERLQRQVAVKVLARAFSDSPDFIERFRREALTAAGLVHPNIAQVYDYGIDGDSHFIVMEYVPGTDLARLLRDHGRIAPAAAVDIAEQVCAALAAAHQAGVVHRDIKPSNVIVSDDGRVKVTDFGIARSRGEVTLTEAGTVMGTAAYIPPEQAQGRSATPASDIYSLGILLFQMLTGELPFSGDTPIAIALRHLDEPVPPPSSKVRGLPAALDEVVFRATAKAPEDRYRDADAMARALGRREAAAVDATRALAVGAQATSVLDVRGQQHTTALPATPETSYAAAPHAQEAPPVRRQPTRRRVNPLPWVLLACGIVLVLALVAMLTPGNDTPTANANRPSATKASQSTPTTSDATTTARPDGRTVPDGIVGMQRDAAVDQLIGLGVNVRWVLVRSSQPEGAVLGTVPAQGEPMKRGQTVALVVSRGKAPDHVNSTWVVPGDLIGMSGKDAEDRLGHEDVRVTRVTIPTGGDGGQVVATWPAAGQPTTEGVVVLVVSGDTGGKSDNKGTGSSGSGTGGDGNSSD
ncbi:protein kinase domain-containing protein [Monashia sp. NPDC004114]